MRGVAGLLFVFLGLVMGYMVLSGRFPSSSPVTQSPSSIGTPVVTSQGLATAQRKGNEGNGGNSLGLPTMQHLTDIAGSTGGMKQ